jgi:hypothetical protein
MSHCRHNDAASGYDGVSRWNFARPPAFRAEVQRMQTIDRIILETDRHIRASVDRVLQARDTFDQVATVVKKSEAAYLESKATLSRMNGHDRSGRT